jgi:UDP-N-acetylmuramyl pentapeptide phosphotransferase/UDP-N-acetylglucosamine-1-phosphate transferase
MVMNIENALSALAPYAAPALGAATVALMVSLIIVATRHWHGTLTLDHPGSVQTAHETPTPRIGGMGIYLGMLIAWSVMPAGETKTIAGTIMLAGLPAWLFGMAEDITKRVGVVPRLLATMFSGVLACMFSGVALTRLDLPLVDQMLTWWPLAVAFTAFAVGGVANSINIIDGFHGLASGTSILALLALTALAMLAGDLPLAGVSLVATAAVFGFWLVNYPWGKLFMGDGGAYFTGFVLAWLAVLLPMRNPGTSPWASLMVCAYPFIEVIYSMLRRRLERKKMGDPDSQHLHSLLSRTVVNQHLGRLSNTLKNAAVAPMIWMFVAGLIALAINLRESTGWLATSLATAALAYHLAYRLLARSNRQGQRKEPG